MATGGTIPSNRTQTVTFYNTSGVIEKDKLIYLAPRFKTMTGFVVGHEVRSVFLSALNGVCPPSSAYKNIAISGWSPQDRTLVVKGNIDDFRLVTEEGDCLNYFVITRTVTKGEGQQAVAKTYYYGFFITGVEQAGGSSVKLTAEPDDFTNVFYLHNKHVLTQADVNAEYEPFNEKMKNCHVNRQHYNRVKKLPNPYWTLDIDLTEVQTGLELADGQQITITFEDQNQTEVTGEIVYFDDRDYEHGNLHVRIKTSAKSNIGVPENYSHITYQSNDYTCDYTYSSIEWNYHYLTESDNLRIFLNQEESFKYKYQYRDKKIPFSMGNIFSEADLNEVRITDSFSSLSSSLKTKIVKSCIQYLIVEMKSQEKIKDIGAIGVPETQYVFFGHVDFMNNIEGLKRVGPVLFVPFINVPDIFMKYEGDLVKFNSVIFKVYGTNVYSNSNQLTYQRTYTSADLVYSYLNKNALADYVYSSYVVSDIGVPDDLIEVDFTNNLLVVVCTNFYTIKEKMIAPVPIRFLTATEEEPIADGLQYTYNSAQDFLDDIPNAIYHSTKDDIFVMFMLSGYYGRTYQVDIEESIPDIKNVFFDNVLESEPYSFYSISYLSYEMTFNRNRYYETNSLLVDYYISVNGAVKLEFIPSYTVEAKTNKYFNEGLVFTLSSSLPIISDSYSSYYYQNQAQMKNQFAVNDYNRGVDLAQHFFNSGPNAVGQQAFKKGWIGAVSETINQFSQMADELVDWGQSNKVIEMNQKAKLADVGAKPDNVKQTGSDVFADLITRENRTFLNHYTIDERSYNSIAKFLERFGYQVNLYDELHTMDRVGWNYVKLNSFDWYGAEIMNEQEDNIKKMFSQGVTLLHNKTYLTTGHNYETILDD